MINQKLKWIKIAPGNNSLMIPVYSIGCGQPSIALTCSVHGDERASLFIINNLINKLKILNSIDGTVNIIPTANPSAQYINNRVSFVDQKDLNRVGKGNVSGSYTEKVGAKLFDFLTNCDLVINLHEFGMCSPVTAVYMNVGDETVKRKIIDSILTFSPDIVWVIKANTSTDSIYNSTLDSAIAKAGIPNFPVETSSSYYISDSDIDKVSNGIINVLNLMGIIESPIKKQKEKQRILSFYRKQVFSDYTGIWEPEFCNFQFINKNTYIGKITTIPEFETIDIKSKAEGYLMNYRKRQFVSIGESIYSIGESAEIFR